MTTPEDLGPDFLNDVFRPEQPPVIIPAKEVRGPDGETIFEGVGGTQPIPKSDYAQNDRQPNNQQSAQRPNSVETKHRRGKVAIIVGATALALGVVVVGGQALTNSLAEDMNHSKHPVPSNTPTPLAKPTPVSSDRPVFVPPYPTASPTSEMFPSEDDEPTPVITVTAIPSVAPAPTVTVTQSAKPAPTVTVTQSAKPAPTRTVTATATETYTPTPTPTAEDPTTPYEEQGNVAPNGMVVGLVSPNETSDGSSVFDRVRRWFDHGHDQKSHQADDTRSKVAQSLRAAGYAVVDSNPVEGLSPDFTINFTDGSEQVKHEKSGWFSESQRQCLSSHYGEVVQQELGSQFHLSSSDLPNGFAGEPVIGVEVDGNSNADNVATAIVDGIEQIDQSRDDINSECS